MELQHVTFEMADKPLECVRACVLARVILVVRRKPHSLSCLLATLGAGRAYVQFSRWLSELTET